MQTPVVSGQCWSVPVVAGFAGVERTIKENKLKIDHVPWKLALEFAKNPSDSSELIFFELLHLVRILLQCNIHS